MIPHPRFLLSHLSGLVLWPFKPHGPPPVTLVAAASGLQYWLDRDLCELACLGAESRIDTTKRGRESRRWGLGIVVRGPLLDILTDWALQYLPLLVRSTIDEESRSSHLWKSLPRSGFSGGSVTRRLQPHSPFPDNNWCGNGTERALKPSKLA